MALERTPDALHNHQYWRLITPLFVHSGGWRQIAFNFPAIAITGCFAERIFDPHPWLIIYFLAGLSLRPLRTRGNRSAAAHLLPESDYSVL